MLQPPENSLSKIGLSFLESYYKHRPRLDEGISTTIDLTFNKTIVNGILNYKEKNGQTYFAIFKIIDSGTSKRAVFDINRPKLLRHGFLFSSLVASCFSFVGTFFTTIPFVYLFLFIFFGPVFLIYYVGGIYLGHYRDLAYMDDLKKCQANEKWIAISGRSLTEFSKEEYELLKEKCIQQGLGLFSISYTSNSTLLVPPINLRKQRTPVNSSKKKILFYLSSFLLLILFSIVAVYFAPKIISPLKKQLGYSDEQTIVDTTQVVKQDSIAALANSLKNTASTKNLDTLQEQALFHNCGHLLAHFDQHKTLAKLFQVGKGPHLYIIELQHILHLLGFSKELGKEGKEFTGIYGRGVVAAVKAFAQKNRIDSDGKQITPKLAAAMQKRVDGLPFLHQLQRDLNEGKVEEKYKEGSPAKVSVSSLQYVLNELGLGQHLNWEDRGNDGVFDNEVLKALKTHLKEDFSKASPHAVYLLLKDIGTYYGSSWTYHIKSFSGNEKSALYHFSASNFIGKPLIVNAEFVPALQKINEYAKKNKVQIYVNDSFRPAHAKVRGAIVKPASHSNHKIGHGIDMNIKHEGGWARSKDMYKTNEANWPAAVKGFLSDVRKDSSLRWGGEFHSSPDPVHIDDNLNHHHPSEWKELFEKTQKAYENHDIHSME